MANKDRERLEVTFGKKDMDLWKYLDSFGVAKASLVKRIIREHKELKGALVPGGPKKEIAPAAVEDITSIADTPVTPDTSKEDSKPKEVKNSSPFSGLSVKK